MKDKMIVTIIIPVYNVSKYIERCIKSVMNQTVQNIECLLINDATPDDSIIKARKLLQDYTGDIDFKIIEHNTNSGVSVARNTGIKKAIGEYVYFLDSDDEISPNCIEDMMIETQKFPSVEVVQGNMEYIPYSEYYDLKKYYDVGFIEDNAWVRKEFFTTNSGMTSTVVNKLIKRSFILDNKLFFEEGIKHEDEMWLYWFAKKLRCLSFLPKVTYFYYRNPNSTMTSMNANGHIKSWNIIFEHILNNLDSPYFKAQLFKYFRQLLWKYEGFVDEGCFDSIKRLFLKKMIGLNEYSAAWCLYKLNPKSSKEVQSFYHYSLSKYSDSQDYPLLMKIIKYYIKKILRTFIKV